MKLSPTQEKRLAKIRYNLATYATASGCSPNDRTDAALIKKGAIIYVGVGQKTLNGWTGGTGYIAAEDFDVQKFTKLHQSA